MIIRTMEDAPESILSLVCEFLEFLKSKNKEKHHSISAAEAEAEAEAVARCVEDSSDYEETVVKVVDDLGLLSGMLYRPGQSAISLEEMDRAIAKNATESDERIRYEYTGSLPDEGYY